MKSHRIICHLQYWQISHEIRKYVRFTGRLADLGQTTTKDGHLVAWEAATNIMQLCRNVDNFSQFYFFFFRFLFERLNNASIGTWACSALAKQMVALYFSVDFSKLSELGDVKKKKKLRQSFIKWKKHKYHWEIPGDTKNFIEDFVWGVRCFWIIFFG